MQRYGGGDLPLPELSRACLLAVGSICGAAIFGGKVFKAVSNGRHDFDHILLLAENAYLY